uniref:Uncharacterized protein n=1 Tax=Anguilla anguilla TaxID=7936 RepID=A0A0E9WFK7_ANGAN
MSRSYTNILNALLLAGYIKCTAFTHILNALYRK